MILGTFAIFFVLLSIVAIFLAELFNTGVDASVPYPLFALIIIITGLVGFGLAAFTCESNKRNQAVKNNVGFYSSTNGAFYFKNLNDK